jgi:hypothetical protein
MNSQICAYFTASQKKKNNSCQPASEELPAAHPDLSTYGFRTQNRPYVNM